MPAPEQDNIDVAGLPTTAACREFAYVPTEHARAVQPLLDAGKACGQGAMLPLGSARVHQTGADPGGTARLRRYAISRRRCCDGAAGAAGQQAVPGCCRWLHGGSVPVQVACAWARPTWTSLHAAWWARARPTASRVRRMQAAGRSWPGAARVSGPLCRCAVARGVCAALRAWLLAERARGARSAVFFQPSASSLCSQRIR